MLLSAEIRWFWSGPVSCSDILRWFTDPALHPFKAGGGSTDEPREDFYLSDSGQPDLGIKQRGATPTSGSKIEVKSLVAVEEFALQGPFGKTVELWVKQESKALKLDPKQLIQTKKVRWLRKFDSENKFEVPLSENEVPLEKYKFPKLGCNLEVTGITLQDGTEWHSLGFESFGGLSNVKSSLLFAVGTMVGRKAHLPADARFASYPAWLRQLPTAP
jgi:hypothetical protein